MLFSRRLGSILASILLKKVKANPIKRSKRKFSDEILDKLLKVLHPASADMGDKVSIIGVGNVGMACAISILSRYVSQHICLYDKDYDRLQGEVYDLEHGSIFLHDARIEAASELKATENSKICIVCAGANQKKGETALNLLERNASVFKHLIPDLVKYSPNTILMIVSNPVDILTHVAWKLSGLPMYKVFGTGTFLDTARFRVILAKKMGISVTNVHGYIIGEHGDNSVAAWSGVYVGGTLLQNIHPRLGKTDDKERWEDMHKEVIKNPKDVLKLKGYTNWAIGLSVSDLTWACLGNTLRILPVSTSVKGIHGIEDDVFLSLPCVLSSNGISKVVIQNLSDNEKAKLIKSAKIMHDIHSKLNL